MKQTAQAKNASTLTWNGPVVGSDWYKVPFFPDGNATYWFFAVSRSPGDTTSLRLQGEFGHARYQSLTVYDDSGIVNCEDVAGVRFSSQLELFRGPALRLFGHELQGLPMTTRPQNLP